MHISNIKGKVKSGSEWAYDLGQYTLIVGRNAQGKSRIPIAVELAVSASTDGIQGKETVKTGQTLAQLGDGQEAYALATLSDGSQSNWGVRREGDTVKTPMFEPAACIDPESVVPLRAVRAALAGKDSEARKKFLDWTGQATTLEDVLARLPSHLHVRYREVIKTQEGSPAQVLVKVADYAKRREKEIEEEAKAHDRVLESLGGFSGELPSEEKLQAAQQAVEQWQTGWRKAVAWEAVSDTQEKGLEVLQAERTAASAALEEARGAHGQWVAVLEGLPAPQAERGRAGVLLLTGHGDACPMCSSMVGRAHLAECSAHFWTLSEESPERKAAREAVDAWGRVVQERQAVLENLDRQIASRVGALGDQVENPGVSALDAAKACEQWRTELARLQNLKNNWDTLKKARDQAAALRAEAPAMADLATNCTTVLSEVLKSQTSKFEERVQRYLPERWKFALVLKDGDKETFRCGFKRDSRVDTLLSGTESDAMELAVAMAVAEMGGASIQKGRPKKKATGEKLFIAIPSDRDRDEETLGELMRAWSKFPGQVIVESTKKPKGKFPAGWTLIDLDILEDARAKQKADLEEREIEQVMAQVPGSSSGESIETGQETEEGNAGHAGACGGFVTPPGSASEGDRLSLPPPPPPPSPSKDKPAPDPALLSLGYSAELLSLGYSAEEMESLRPEQIEYIRKHQIARPRATRHPTGWTFPVLLPPPPPQAN